MVPARQCVRCRHHQREVRPESDFTSIARVVEEGGHEIGRSKVKSQKS
jgi:hypothetical protein